jgi:hypothetical protein
MKAAELRALTVKIREKLETSDRWLIRGILAIYARQTADEKSAEETVENNGIGFSGFDAQILSSYATQILEWEAGRSTYRNPLSRPQIEAARRKMAKYAGQLARISAAREAAATAAEAAAEREAIQAAEVAA